MPKPSLKDAILDAGLKVMFRTGYHGTSVRDVTAAAGAITRFPAPLNVI